jgi:hypothetical protein
VKVGVLKLGSRISFNSNDTSGGNGEARSIINMLDVGGAEVHIFTKILAKDNLLPQYRWHNILSGELGLIYQKLDALVVLNGNVNFFGGAEDASQLMNYRILNCFSGPVFYIYCDPELTLKQVWPSVSKKPWSSKWQQCHIEITRDDIVYISQPHDISKLDFGKNEVKPAKVIHFPFEQFPCLNDLEQLPFNPKPDVDLSYGGTMRGGKRIEKMLKYYFGHPPELKVEMFGKIELEDFAKWSKNKIPPMFTGPVKYADMLPKMNKAMAHCVIGDPYYEEINDIPQRAYESIWSSVVTFVDHDMDKLRRIYGRDKQLADFLYVQTREELSEKLLLLKGDALARQQIIEEQFKAIDFDPQRYCSDFLELLK